MPGRTSMIIDHFHMDPQTSSFDQSGLSYKIILHDSKLFIRIVKIADDNYAVWESTITDDLDSSSKIAQPGSTYMNHPPEIIYKIIADFIKNELDPNFQVIFPNGNNITDNNIPISIQIVMAPKYIAPSAQTLEIFPIHLSIDDKVSMIVASQKEYVNNEIQQLKKNIAEQNTIIESLKKAVNVLSQGKYFPDQSQNGDRDSKY